MSILADRAQVMQHVARQESSPAYRQWLREHMTAVDADGFQVVCAFAPSELAKDVLSEVVAYDHPVIVSTLVDDRVALLELGGPVPDDPQTETLRIDDSDYSIEDVATALAADPGRLIVLRAAAREPVLVTG